MKKIYLVFIVIALFLTIGVIMVRANPSYFALEKSTSVATTTPVYQTAGTATSTLVYDTYAAGSNTKTDSLSLGIQYIGSSTASVLGWRYEYSNGYPGNDCITLPLSCDWYQLGVGNSAVATSTYISGYAENLLVAASSSPGGRTAPIDGSLKLVNVPTSTRYVRVVLYSFAGNGSVWAQFIPAKERTE